MALPEKPRDTFIRGRLIQLLEEKIDEINPVDPFGKGQRGLIGPREKDLAKENITLRMRQAMGPDRWEKGVQEFTRTEYLNLYGLLNETLSQLGSVRNADTTHLRHVYQGLLPIIADVGRRVYGMSAEEFRTAQLSPELRAKFISGDVSSGMRTSMTDETRGTVIARDLGDGLARRRGGKTAAASGAGETNPPAPPPPGPEPVIMDDAYSAITRETFGDKLMNLRARYVDEHYPKGMTEQQLADRLNGEVKLNTIRGEHVKNWESNRQLEMITGDELLKEALKSVLIDLNDQIKEPDKKRHRRIFDEALESTLVLVRDRPDRLRNIRFSSPFESALKHLRSDCGYNEQDLAVMVNARMGELAAEKSRGAKPVTLDDIIAYQTGRLPDKMTLVKLSGALNLTYEQSQNFLKSWQAAIDKKAGEAAEVPPAETTETVFADAARNRRGPVQKRDALVPSGGVSSQALRERLEAEVLAPLKELFETPGLTKIQNFDQTMRTGFPAGGRGGSAERAAQTLEGWIEAITEAVHTYNEKHTSRKEHISKARYEPLLNSWKHLNKAYHEELAKEKASVQQR